MNGLLNTLNCHCKPLGEEEHTIINGHCSLVRVLNLLTLSDSPDVSTLSRWLDPLPGSSRWSSTKQGEKRFWQDVDRMEEEDRSTWFDSKIRPNRDG